VSTNQQEVITAAELRAVETERKSLVVKFSERYGIEPNKLMRTLKATAFKGDVTDEQMAALLIVADQHGLNPWTKEIYAFPSRTGIVPVVGVDGWARITNTHPAFDGMEFLLNGEPGKESYTCTIHRKDHKHPTTVTEYMSECYRPTDPWKSHPLRMLRHKAMIQCARLAFSFAGIYDPDEAERVLAAEAIDVTPGAEGAEQETNFGTAKISPVKMRKIVEGAIEAAAKNDAKALLAVWGALTKAECELVWKQLRSYERSAIKKLEATDEYRAERAGGLVPWSLELVGSCNDAASLETAWRAIQDAFAENDAQVPADVETVYIDRKAELGA